MIHIIDNSERRQTQRNLQAADDALKYVSENATFHRQHTFLSDPLRSNQLILLRPSEVPAYLHNSAFYNGLALDNNEEFSVPIECFKPSLQLTSVTEFDQLMRTLHFWGCNDIFSEVLHYVYNVLERKHVRSVCTAYVDRFPYLGVLSQLRPYFFAPPHTGRYFHVLNKALLFGVLDIVVFLREQGHTFNQESILYALRSKSIPCLRYVLEQGVTDEPVEKPFRKIFSRSHFVPTSADLELIRYCVANGITDVLTIDAARIAAELGDVELLQELHELRCPFDATICAKAAGAGHLNCLILAQANGVPWDEETCAAAAKGRHMECLTYAIENGCPGDERVSNIAIENDDYEMLVFAHENLLPWEDDMCMLAALKGSLRCLRYVHEAGCALTAETCSAAAWSYNIECLKYAHENGAPWDITTTINAAKCNNYTAIQYAAARGCPVDAEVSIRAITKNCTIGHVMFMCDNNFPMHPDMCRVAARFGLLSHLQLLHEGGCPWNATTTRDASRLCELETLKYAAENGCPVEVVPCACSVDPEHFECMKYVFDNYDDTFNPIPAIIHDHHECYMHAYDNGCEWTELALLCGARLGKLDFLEYAFYDGQCPYYPHIEKIYAAALENGHGECVEMLDTLSAQKKLSLSFSVSLHSKIRSLAARARQTNKRWMYNVNKVVHDFLYAVLVTSGLELYIQQYVEECDVDMIEGSVWEETVLDFQQISVKAVDPTHSRYVNYICDMLLSTEYHWCILHLHTLIITLKYCSASSLQCRRKLRRLSRTKRRYKRPILRKVFVGNHWTDLLDEISSTWVSMAEMPKHEYFDSIMST